LWCGVGERRTPQPCGTSCDKVSYTDVLAKASEDDAESKDATVDAKHLRQGTKLVNVIRNAIEDASDDAGWAALGPVGSFIGKQFNDFDSRTYGYSKLSSLVKAIGLFEYEERQAGTGKTLYVRNKNKKGK